MRKILSLLVAMLTLTAVNASAAMFEASPTPLQESSKGVVITFHAEQSGVTGLMNVTTDLYAHVGVNTNKGSWQHVVSEWGKTGNNYVFKRVSANTFQLTIGDMRSYFGITDANEHINQICIIARNAVGTVQTKDNFIDVHPDGFALALSATPNEHVITKSTAYTFTASTSQAATITIYDNDTQVASKSGVQTLTYTHTYSTPGTENIIKVVANNGKESLTEEYNVFYVANSPQGNYPGGGKPKQGAVRNADGTVTFCLMAPQKSSVVLVGSWDEYVPMSKNTMKYQDYQGYRYFWTTVSGLDDHTWYPYYYLVDGKYNVADPYARLILDPYSDKWLEGDGNAWPIAEGRPEYPYNKFEDIVLAAYRGDFSDMYKWRSKNFTPIDKGALTIYELCLRDFTGTSNKADGTLRQAIEKIPYLDDLGVTAIELMPLMEFDGNNSWGYATNAFMAVDKVYGSPNDLKEFIDECHLRGISVFLDIVFNHTPGLHPWYMMYDQGKSPFYNASAPHNFGVYNDIKQDYAPVEAHWIDVLTFWMNEYRVDGFRFDLVKGLGDTSSYSGNYDVNNRNSSIVNRMKRLHSAMLKVNPKVVHINEFLGNYDDEVDMGNDGQLQWNNQSGNGQSYAAGGWTNLSYLNAANCSRPNVSTVDYFESHDEPWVGYSAKTSTDTKLKNSLANRMLRLGSMGCQLLMSPGAKMIWQFGELGYDEQMTEDNRVSPKPVHWDYLNNQYRAGVHEAYRQLNWMRRSNPDMFNGSVYPVYNNFSNDARSVRVTKGSKEVIAFINANTKDARDVSVTSQVITGNNYRVVAASKGFNPTLTSGTSKNLTINVPANSFCVLANKSLVGVEDIEIDGANAAIVYGGDGEIIIAGEYNDVEVYNISGQRMGSLNVTPGIYIVNVDGNVTKVVVK